MVVVTANVLQRTLCIRRGRSVGTAFTLDHRGREYIVTARHVVPDIGTSGGVIAVRYDRLWGEIHVGLVAVNDEADVAVLEHGNRLTPNHPLEMSSRGLFQSQSVAFVGFPYGWNSGHEEINRGFPMPFVKGGIVSAYVSGPPAAIYIDAHGNPGFSGGPLVFGLAGDPLLKVAGVIASSPRNSATPDDEAGFVKAFDILHTISLIDASIDGAALSR